MCFSFKKTKGLPPPAYLQEIKAIQIQDILKNQFPTANLYLSDSIYKTTTIDELMRFLKDDKTNEYRYVSEYMDCDDFSYHLMGSIHNVEWGALPFGIIWLLKPNGAHAMNIFIDNQHGVYLIEPQNDIIQVFPSNWTAYLIII